MGDEVDEQRQQSEADEDRDQDLVARLETERDAVIAGVHELDARHEANLFAGDDRVLDEVLGVLVGDEHQHEHERRADIGA